MDRAEYRFDARVSRARPVVTGGMDMVRATMIRAAIAAAALVAGAALGAESLQALASVAPGVWQLHEIGAQGAGRAICVRDPRALLQIEHGTANCTQSVIDQSATKATVRYACPGLGNGTTNLSVESDSIVRVHTQGILRGAPFDVDYEARRQGACR